MEKKEELQSALRRILNDYPTVRMDQGFKGDSYTITQKGLGIVDGEDDIVGVYTIEGWRDGMVTEEDIRADIEEYIREATAG